MPMFSANDGLDADLVNEYPCITFADAAVFNGVIVIELACSPSIAWMSGHHYAKKTPQNSAITA